MTLDRKEQILDFITQYIQDHCYPPTVREIADGVGIKSTSGVHEYLRRMYESGMIETDAPPGSTRAIRVPGYNFVKEE